MSGRVKMNKKFGASANCYINGEEEIMVGYPDEGGDQTLDWVGNDLKQLEATILEDCSDLKALHIHPYIGCQCDLGGEVVSVIIDTEDLEPGDNEQDAYVYAVIFKDPCNREPVDVDREEQQ